MYKQALIFAALLFGGTCVGLFAGYKIASAHALVHEWHSLDNPEGHEFFTTYDLMARMRLADMGSATRLQNPKEEAEARREYLNLILEVTEKGKHEVTNPAALTLIDVETGITYVRLAMVEQAAGNAPVSQTWMQKAQATLKQAGWKDCSEAHLRDVALALNKRDSL